MRRGCKTYEGYKIMKMSVLVPTLGQREKEIIRLLDSLQNQNYDNYEIVIVTQVNHDFIKQTISGYKNMDIIQVKINETGLSKARNRGLEVATGEIVLLSDDDCWYPSYALSSIADKFKIHNNVKILLTQIYDPMKKELYKQYSKKEGYISNKLQLMRKSSIEIAFKRNMISYSKFDERFGLGSEFVCGEELDFLLNNYAKNTIFYTPKITVYHKKKENSSNNKQIIAKGAIYGKNFNVFICLLVLVRDLIIKRENNFKYFWKGYNEYFKRTN